MVEGGEGIPFRAVLERGRGREGVGRWMDVRSPGSAMNVRKKTTRLGREKVGPAGLRFFLLFFYRSNETPKYK